MLTLLAATTVFGMTLSAEVVMGLITTFVSPAITQLLKSINEKFVQYSTFTNQVVAVAIMSLAWLLFDRASPYEAWLTVAMGAGGAGTSLFNVWKASRKKNNA